MVTDLFYIVCTSIADDQLLRDDRFCGGGEEEEEVEHRGTSTVSGYEGTTKNVRINPV